MKKPKKKKKAPDAATPALGRLGAERWIAVRQKTGAGPIEPKARKGTRTQREREALRNEIDPDAGKDV